MKNYLSLFLFLITTLLSSAQTPMLWGLTYMGGGTNNTGIILNYNITTGIETNTYNFVGTPSDGSFPLSSFIKANNGLLYGVTNTGGSSRDGTIFSYNINTSAETNLHNFSGHHDGQNPFGSLIQASNNLLYGMTQVGGIYDTAATDGDGTLFSYNISTGVETVIHNFGNGTDGINPYGSLLQASNGLLYGMVESGGIYGDGIIFSYNIANDSYTILYNFGEYPDGENPHGSLIQVNDSLLYGMTSAGGINDAGTIFSYNISKGTETDLHDFGSGTDGKDPEYGNLLLVSDSLLYGMTKEGGVDYRGIIFSYNILTGKETDLHDFGSGTDGQTPFGSLIRASNGFLYGMTTVGGTNGLGTIFSYNITTGIEAKLHDFGSSKDGQTPAGSFIEVDTVIISVTPIIATICGRGSVALVATGATTYTWSPATGLSTTTGDSVIASPTVTTTYTVTGIENSSTYSTTVTVTVNPNPIIIVNVPLPICNGSSATLIASGGTTYTWSPSAGLNATTGDSVIASPTATTIYMVTGDSLGCKTTTADTVKVFTAPPLTILPQPPPSFCSGSNAELKVKGGGTNFIWTPVTGLSDTTSGDSVLAGPTVTTTYTVSGNDSLGCTASGTEKVTVFPAPIIPTFTQNVDTLKSSAQYENQWYLNDTLLVGDTSQYLTITTGGEYWVSVTNEANGCSSASDSADITTGINQLTVDNGQVTVYPNPTNNNVTIKMTTACENCTLNVTDILGRAIYSQPVSGVTTIIDLKTLPPEVYFIQLRSGSLDIVKKIVKG